MGKQIKTGAQAPAVDEAVKATVEAMTGTAPQAPQAPQADDDDDGSDTRTVADLEALALADDDADGYRSAVRRARVVVKRYNSAWNNARYASDKEQARFKGLSARMQADPKEIAKRDKVLSGLQADYDEA